MSSNAFRGFLGSLPEMVHLLGAAWLLGSGVALAALSAPNLVAGADGLSIEEAARWFETGASTVFRYGPWVAAAAFVAAAAAPFVRGESRRAVPIMRAICMAGCLGVVLFADARNHDLLIAADVESGSAADLIRVRSDKMITPWNGLLVLAGVNLLFAALQIGGAARSD